MMQGNFTFVRLPQATLHGLTSDEAKARLLEYGPNKLPESTRNPFLVYLGYMWNPLSWAMEAAAIIAICLLDYPDFALILGLLLINATISFVEESSADKAIKVIEKGVCSSLHACCTLYKGPYIMPLLCHAFRLLLQHSHLKQKP